MDQSQSTTPTLEYPAQANGFDSAPVADTGGYLILRITWVLRLFMARRKMIFRIFVFGILVSLLIAFILPPVFTSTTTLMPPDSASPSMDLMGMISSAGNAGSAASFASAALGLKTPGALFVGILD